MVLLTNMLCYSSYVPQNIIIFVTFGGLFARINEYEYENM